MKASIIVPTRGGARRLPMLLASLAAQTHRDWEAIVVIDGDIDESEAVVRRYAHLPIRALVFPENRGRAAALNAGLAAVSGDVLIRADDDFELDPGHLSAHVQCHEASECGVIGLPRNIAPPTRYMRVYGLDADRRGREKAYQSAPDARWRLWGGNVSISRASYERIGGYDTRYRGYGWEDVDYGYRLQQAGIPIVLAQGAEVLHHVASTTTAIRARRAFDSGAARWTFDTIHGIGASGPAEPEAFSPWNRTVVGLSRWLTLRRSDIVARCVDGTIHVLPSAIARRTVGMVVEASSVAGYRSARDADDANGVPRG